MLFKKKIVFTEGMNETLCSFDEIPWFSCCGVPYDKPSYYPYLQEKDPKRAEKLLLHTKNYSGTVCLTNLFKEGICRADTFILQTAGWKFYQNEFMPCVEASWRTYEKRALKANGLDLNSAGKRFLRGLFLCRKAGEGQCSRAFLTPMDTSAVKPASGLRR